MNISTILIETVSIQQYIFSSNKLKENIGASYIIEHMVYDKVMTDVLKNMFNSTFSNSWKDKPGTIAIKNGYECEIGYIGGGNALVLFKDGGKVEEFIRIFSKECLLQFPALRLAFGINNSFDLNNFSYSMKNIVSDLNKTKASYSPLTSIPKHGITTDCPLSNQVAEPLFDKKVNNYISRASYIKMENSENDKYNSEKFTLTKDIEKLGQDKEASYISVVHIDGNGMGKKFSEIDDLVNYRKNSIAVTTKATGAMDNLIRHVEDLYRKDDFKELKENKEGAKTTLPIRPILVGGDDITFICEGKIGVYMAEKFISLFFDKAERKKDEKDRIMDGACAGVAIVKTHFPFYKAVQLAEELCSEAKKLSRDNHGSYISFYYTSTTFSGSIDELRNKTHKTPDDKELYYGPYKLFDNSCAKSMDNLKSGIKHFKTKWSHNKVMKLREVLFDNEVSQELFLQELKEINYKLPNKKNILFENDKSEFFDQIDLMDFYLESLLNEKID